MPCTKETAAFLNLLIDWSANGYCWYPQVNFTHAVYR